MTIRPLQWIGWFGRLGLCLASIWLLASIFSALAWSIIDPPGTPLMSIRWLQGAPRPAMARRWQPLQDINPALPRSVIAAEDARFCRHHGFDIKALRRALKRTLKQGAKGGKTAGGSTISQQLAKNLYAWPHRSYLRKGLEAWMTLWIELIWSKRRIMEVYLNSVEWGAGLYGVRQASSAYFGKRPEKLTRQEAARLAIALPNPRTRAPDVASATLRRRARRIMRDAKDIGFSPRTGCAGP